jgi:hypothetical protein
MDQKFGISVQFYLILNKNMRALIRISKKIKKVEKGSILNKNGQKLIFSRNNQDAYIRSLVFFLLNYAIFN